MGCRTSCQKTTFQRVNAQTKTHAEGDAVQQALNAGQRGKVKRADLYVDRPPCRSCGDFGGLRSLTRELGLDELFLHCLVRHPEDSHRQSRIR